MVGCSWVSSPLLQALFSADPSGYSAHQSPAWTSLSGHPWLHLELSSDSFDHLAFVEKQPGNVYNLQTIS